MVTNVEKLVKSFQGKTEQKITELFSGEPELQKKLLALLTQNVSESEEEYYAESSNDSEYESSPILSLNVITNKTQKKFLLHLIGQLLDVKAKGIILKNLKNLSLKKKPKVLAQI